MATSLQWSDFKHKKLPGDLYEQLCKHVDFELFIDFGSLVDSLAFARSCLRKFAQRELDHDENKIFLAFTMYVYKKKNEMKKNAGVKIEPG